MSICTFTWHIFLVVLQHLCICFQVKLRESFREKNLNIFGNFERLLTTNKEGSGFFVGDSVSLLYVLYGI